MNPKERFLPLIPQDSLVILITGGREWRDPDPIRDDLRRLPPNAVVVHGAARGADTLAVEIAQEFGLLAVPAPAHWRHSDAKWVLVYGPCPPGCPEVVGRSAGAVRNRWMLDTYRPHGVLAYHADLHESRGTQDMVRYALTKGVPVRYHDGTASQRLTLSSFRVLCSTALERSWFQAAAVLLFWLMYIGPRKPFP